MSIRTPPHHLADLGVILVAAGRGERLGADRPKAFVELGGLTLLERTARTVLSLPHGGQLVLVVPEQLAGEALGIVDGLATAEAAWRVSVVAGGRERHESVRKGMEALHEGIGTVLVHDAARPLAPAEVFERVIAEVRATGHGAVPAIPVADTLKRVDDEGAVRSTVDRDALVAVQTPQGFPREELEAAHAMVRARGGEAPPTDDAEVVQRAGGTVRTVPGSAFAHKLTTAADLLILGGLLRGAPGGRGEQGEPA